LLTGGVLEIVEVVVGQLVVEQILVNQGGQTQEVTGAGVQPQAGGVNDAATGVQHADVEGRGHRLGNGSRPDQFELCVRLHAGNGLQLYVIPRYDALDAVEVNNRELQRAVFADEDVHQLAGGLAGVVVETQIQQGAGPNQERAGDRLRTGNIGGIGD